MRISPVSSLLVAALVVLRQPCTRNKATARLLLERAAEHDSLSLAEREACLNLADELDIDQDTTSPVRALKPRAPSILADCKVEPRKRGATLMFVPGPKGAAA
ncbi:MAG: hypothetical protein AB1720_10125 [Pseudomonadota bacterium]